MFMTATPLGLRASATARVTSDAPVPAVWAVLADPARWAEFHLCIDSVSDLIGEAGPGDDLSGVASGAADGLRLEPGRRYRARLRLLPFGVPVEIEHVVDRSAVTVTSRLVPGLTEQLEFLLMPSVSGGSVVTVRLTLHGPLAIAALAPRFLARSLSARLLARAAARTPVTVPVAAVA